MSSVIDENGNVIGGMRYPDEERRQKEFEERLRSGIPEPVGAPGQWLSQVDLYPQGKGVTNHPIDPTTGKPYFDYSQGKSTMATAPKQEQIMQLAQAIRQMGMPNPNTRTNSSIDPNFRRYGPGENGPGGLFLPPGVTRTDGMGQIKGAAMMGPPPGGYTPMQYVEANTVENERKWQRRNTPGYDSEGNPLNQNVNLRPAGPLTSTTEEQWQQQLQPYGPQVGGNVSTQPIESQYLDFARQQKGWNPAWDDYLPQLLRFLQNPGIDPTEGYVIGTQPGVHGGGRQPGIPKELWGQIAEFAKTIPGMNDPWTRPVDPTDWRNKVPGGTPTNPYAGTQTGQPNIPTRRGPNGELEGLNPTTGKWETLSGIYSPGTQTGGTPTNPYAGTQTGQPPSVLGDLARKNAIRRQVLAKLMGRPTGANSLMDLLGQQQPY